MTPFAILVQLAGLSQRDAASFLNLSPSSIDKMARGVRSTPDGVLSELRNLIEKQEGAAERALELIEEQGADRIEIGYPSDDYEAQTLGWPCVGAWAAMTARVMAGTDAPVVLVPRGSTRASAAAVDVHDKGREDGQGGSRT